ESMITGESVPVEKRAQTVLDRDIPLGDRRNSAFMGTLISYGRGRGVVVATGMNTQIGLIASMLQKLEEEPTPLQQRLEALGKQLGVAALFICAVVFAVAVLRNTHLGLLSAPGGGLLPYLRAFRQELVDVFIIAVSLAIAAVPEGLPAVVTITLAMGMREMIRRHALIRRLASVETLGSATVICSDKTGTLTQNEMTATHLWVDGRTFELTGRGYQPVGELLLDGRPANLIENPAATTALWAAVLASDAELEHTGASDMAATFRVVGDPTEGALIVAGLKAAAFRDQLNAAYPRVAEIPFDSERKRMVTIHDVREPHSEDASPFDDDVEAAGEIYAVIAKGAPDMILELCTHLQRLDDESTLLTPALRQQVLDANATMAGQALRVLGVAYRTIREIPHPLTPESVECDLTFIGLTGMIDPPRPEVLPAIEHARHAGIRTVMITGDYPATARAIADAIGLLQPGHRVISGAELDRLGDAALAAQIGEIDAFARVSPEHKVRIVDALRREGEVVAMTGDGVNDAPALKRADIGVAMGITGTDVAKGAADMVLTDNKYVSIVAALEQGRIIYGNIRKFVFFLLSSNVAEIMIIFLATLFGLPTPLTAIQLLWLNLITDGAPALALAVEKGDPDIMDRPPRPRSEPIINGPMRLGILIQTFTQTGAVLTAFALGLLWHLGSSIPAGINPILYLLQYDWSGVDVQTAETMAFLTLSPCELFRAYTVLSERISIFRLGMFSNRAMQYAVGVSLALLLLVVSVPFLQPIFNTHPPAPREWAVVLGLALIPAISEEITKAFLRLRDRRQGEAGA
ncbi:MAG: cation-translocating P-type ATPase, partial [Chloroflexi bacterium]|nr:cation-translocating P-type ATPase [Chloroflexota bacterium]